MVYHLRKRGLVWWFIVLLISAVFIQVFPFIAELIGGYRADLTNIGYPHRIWHASKLGPVFAKENLYADVFISVVAMGICYSMIVLSRLYFPSGNCTKCGYDLRGSLHQPDCPECGETIPIETRLAASASKSGESPNGS